MAGFLVSACTDARNPLEPKSPQTIAGDVLVDNEVVVVEDNVPESVKNAAPDASLTVVAGPRISANLLTVPRAAFTSVGGTTYSVSAVSFSPEVAPTANFGPNCDDCIAFNTPIGFTFTFYGNSYTQLNLSSNGFVQFGGTPANVHSGCCRGGLLPSADGINNIIALSWTDWYPPSNPSGFRYETRGTAPTRRFIVQWTNVPEFFNTGGSLTAQLVLYEGSNDIAMYTTSQTIINNFHLVTQGIENAAGTEATFVTGRVQQVYGLSGDAVRFTTHSNTAPSITAPPNLTFDTDPGVCAASVAQADLGTPTVTDDAPGYTVGTPVRSDDAALDAPYPHGATTVTWTVTDAEGLPASADQTVTVNDTENPAINSVPPVTVSTDPGQPFATVGDITPSATDNCGEVSVAGPGAGTYPIGTTTVAWVATDGSGNQGATSTTITVLDLESPVLNVPASFTVPATMPTGAMVTFSASATDNSGSVSVVCTPSSGSVYGIGTTSTTCTATDPSGNDTSRSFNVTVLGAADQLRNLIAFVESRNLPNGTENPLVNQARAALNHVAENPPDISCKKLNDFLRKLQDHKAEQNIAPLDLVRMETDAKRIRNVLGCSLIQS